MNLNVSTKLPNVADQTPTPTRFIRNCEEVGLFQDLQNVNPFEETFRKAVEAGKQGLNSLMGRELCTALADDTLHTPNVFPHINEPQPSNQQNKLSANNNPSLEQHKTNEPPKKPRKYRKKQHTDGVVPGSVVSPHFVAVDSKVTFKLPLPQIASKVKVFSPKYFSVLLKNASKNTDQVQKSLPKLKKVSDDKNDDKTRSRSDLLEYNRLAAMRAREKKKHHLAYLQKLNQELTEKNLILESKLSAMTSKNRILEQKFEILQKNHMNLLKRGNSADVQTEKTSQNESKGSIAIDARESLEMDLTVTKSYIDAEHSYLAPASSLNEEKSRCFYTTLPGNEPPQNSEGFLRKPFKKRNIHPKLCLNSHSASDSSHF